MDKLQSLYKERDLLIADSIDHDIWNHFGKLHKYLHNDAPSNNPMWPTVRWGIDNIHACRHTEMNETWVRQALDISTKIEDRRKWLKYNTVLTKGEVLAKALGISNAMPRLKDFERVYRTNKIELIGLKTKWDPTLDVSEPVLAVMPAEHLFDLTPIDNIRSRAHNDKSGITLAAEKLESTEDEDFDVYRLITFTTDDDGNTHFHKHYAASYGLPTYHAAPDKLRQLFAMVKTRKNLDQRLSTVANKWLKAMDTPYSWNNSYIRQNEMPNYIATNLGRMIHYSELALIRKTVYAGYHHDSFEANAMLATLQSNS